MSDTSDAHSTSRPRSIASTLRSVLPILAVFAGCERAPLPPPAPADAQATAATATSAPTLEQKLERRIPLEPTEVDQLRGVSAEGTLVLFMLNPGTPPELLRAFAANPLDAVRIAVASNPRTPVDALVSLRAAGPGQPINRALAMNPSTPVDVLRDMRAKGEAGDVSLAANPSLPVDLMEDIERRGDEVAREALARNPAVPTALRERLGRGQSPQR